MKGYEDHLKAIRKDLNTLSSTQKSFIDGFLKIFASLTTTLMKSDAVKKEAYPQLMKTFTEALGDSYKSAMPPLESTNPLSVEEKQRLKKYSQKARRGERFSRQEAEDFYNLSKNYQKREGMMQEYGFYFFWQHLYLD